MREQVVKLLRADSQLIWGGGDTHNVKHLGGGTCWWWGGSNDWKILDEGKSIANTQELRKMTISPQFQENATSLSFTNDHVPWKEELKSSYSLVPTIFLQLPAMVEKLS